MSDRPPLPNIAQWIREYGDTGCDEKRAVFTFMEVETSQAAASLRSELYRISQGSLDDEYLDQLVGKKRMARYGSYQNWAGLMLQWMASYKG